jgi:hypothetical protein
LQGAWETAPFVLPVKRTLPNADTNTVSLSPRVRILAAALGVAVLALVAGMFLLSGGGSSNAAVKTIKPLHPVKKHVVPTTKPKAVTKVPAKVPAKPAPKPRPAPKRKLPNVIDGMPATLALALRSHDVVVVSLYTPRSSVDAMATDEARQGAALSGSGFVALSVADNRVVSPLSALLAAAPTPADRVPDGPAVLVFQRPKTLFVRFNGFVDRDTVAQAAANAALLAR